MWISIGDKLPNEFPVFICHEEYKWLAIAKDFSNSKMSGTWMKTDMFDLNPTHWMPVPDIITKAQERL